MTDPLADRVTDIESFITDWITENDVPGVSVVIVDDDAELYAEGFGARDIETNAAASPDTLYGMGSISKSLTALGIMQLDEAGRLSIDDPVNTYVDHYRIAPGEPITIHDLLTHTSGMPASPTGLLGQAFEGLPAGIADERDLERFVHASTEFRDTLDDQFFYYNTGYDILGQVITAVDGRAYADYLAAEIFDPLGMDR